MAMAVGIGTFPTPALGFEIEGKRHWSVIVRRALEPEPDIMDESLRKLNRPHTVWDVIWRDATALASVTPCPGPVTAVVCKIKITDSRLFFLADKKTYLKDSASGRRETTWLTQGERVVVARIFEARLHQAAQAAPKTFPPRPVANLEQRTQIVAETFRAPWQLEESGEYA
jgi:hypothetical protein